MACCRVLLSWLWRTWWAGDCRTYRGEVRSFRRGVKTRLRDGLSSPPAPSVAGPGWKPPSTRQAVRLLSSFSEKLGNEDVRFFNAVRAASPAIAEAADMAWRFHEMLAERKANDLDPWLTQALGSAIASFARRLRRDIDAVRAALSLPWSTGPVEGKINNLKRIKRSKHGYGMTPAPKMRENPHPEESSVPVESR